MSYIVTRTERGRRLERINALDAEEVVDDGKADPVKRGVLYVDRALSRPKEQVPSRAMPPEDLDSVVDEEPDLDPQTYVTRDLQAEAKPAPASARRRRGRPRKKPAQIPNDGE